MFAVHNALVLAAAIQPAAVYQAEPALGLDARRVAVLWSTAHENLEAEIDKPAEWKQPTGAYPQPVPVELVLDPLSIYNSQKKGGARSTFVSPARQQLAALLRRWVRVRVGDAVKDADIVIDVTRRTFQQIPMGLKEHVRWLLEQQHPPLGVSKTFFLHVLSTLVPDARRPVHKKSQRAADVAVRAGSPPRLAADRPRVDFPPAAAAAIADLPRAASPQAADGASARVAPPSVPPPAAVAIADLPRAASPQAADGASSRVSPPTAASSPRTATASVSLVPVPAENVDGALRLDQQDEHDEWAGGGYDGNDGDEQVDEQPDSVARSSANREAAAVGGGGGGMNDSGNIDELNQPVARRIIKRERSAEDANPEATEVDDHAQHLSRPRQCEHKAQCKPAAYRPSMPVPGEGEGEGEEAKGGAADAAGFEIEAILTSKYEHGVKKFKVKWKGYSDCTWEPRSSFYPGAGETLEEFEEAEFRSRKRRKHSYNPR